MGVYDFQILLHTSCRPWPGGYCSACSVGRATGEHRRAGRTSFTTPTFGYTADMLVRRKTTSTENTRLAGWMRTRVHELKAMLDRIVTFRCYEV